MKITYKTNKSELTRLKQNKKVFLQFLPVLKLKQEQLQVELIHIKRHLKKSEDIYKKKVLNVLKNSSVFLDPLNIYDFLSICKPNQIEVIKKSVVGVSIPILKKIVFKNIFVNFFDAPCWLILIIDDLKLLIYKNIEIQIIRNQYSLINKELKKASQKVNLFEKVLIPDTETAIKRINIILGDEQVASVGRAKTAKNKAVKHS